MHDKAKHTPSKQGLSGIVEYNEEPYQHWGAWQWHQLLLEYFFTAIGTQKNYPVTFLSVTKRTLAHIAGESFDDIDSVFLAYRRHLPRTSHDLEAIFEQYWNWESNKNVVSLANLATFNNHPEHLMLLIFSCLVACTDPEENSTQSQYPQRMQSLLGYRDIPQQIRGLACMWRTFAAYLKQRREQNPNGRFLELPSVGFETRIGHAKRLAFPECNDRRRLRRVLQGIDGTALTPDYLAKKFANSAAAQFNDSFHKAYLDFLSHVRRGASQQRLKQTKFFEAISAFVEQETFTNDLRQFDHLRIELHFDMQSTPHIDVLPDGDCSEVPLNGQGRISQGWLFSQAQYCDNRLEPELISALKAGVLLFKQTVGVLWRWSPVPAEQQPILALVNRKTFKNSDRFKGKRWRMFSTWTLLQLDSHQATVFLKSISHSQAQGSGTIRLVGATRVGLGYLINSLSAPQVEAPGALAVQSRIQDGDWAPLQQDDSGAWGPVFAGDGRVLLRAKSPQGGYRHRRFQAHRQALCHPQLAVPKHGIFFEPDRISKPLTAVDLPQPQTATLCRQLEDLLETLYADGQHGLSEVEAIDWIRRAYPDSPVSPWLILQGLVDCGWLQEAYRLAWHSRRFFLRPLSCVQQFIGAARCRVHFEGALPNVLRERIRVAVEALGCELRQGDSLSSFAPSPLFVEATDEQAVAITQRLGCPLEGLKLELLDEEPLERKSGMAVYRTWCWTEGRFMEPEQTKTPIFNDVRLDQLRFTAQSGMDRFQIHDGTRIRQYGLPKMAIRQAFLAAHQPLYELADHELVNLAGYATLPSGLARAWRLQTLTSPGPNCASGSVVSYRYPCPSQDLIAQDKRLSPLIRCDKAAMPFWKKARVLQAISQGSPVQLCQPHGLITPEIYFVRTSQ